MPRSDFNEKHTIVLERIEEGGKHVFHELEVQIPRAVVIAAEEHDDLMMQDKVIMAFEKRFRRRFPTLTVPQDIAWPDFKHPILPTVQARP
jgi:hypothetical protein